MSVPFLDLAQSNAPYLGELEEAALGVIRGGRYLHGHETAAFERELAAQCGAAHAIGVSNGLDAIRLILRAYLEMGRLEKGDYVMVAANTYIATVLPITEFGLRPIFVEPDPDTMNFSWQNALSPFPHFPSPLTPNPSLFPLPQVKAAIITHLYGTPCWDAEAALRLRNRGILIIEDNAQAIGALAAEEGFHGSRATGALGDAAAFSFYPTKNIGALGDAGAVATSDTALSDTIRALANYGSDRRYHNIYRGYNCRMDEIQAAMLRVKLRHLDEETGRRAAIAGVYDSTISNPLVEKPAIFPAMRQVWHQYVVRLPEGLRDRFRTYLAEKGIGTDVHYPDPPYLQPCYSEYADLAQPDRPSIVMSRTCVSLPIANVSPSEALEVSRVINTFQTP